MGARIASAIILLAGCGATLDETPRDGSSPDGSTDASVIDAAIDSPPVDARACAGGDMRATDASGSCFVYFIGPATYAAAETACTAFSARLAVIKSAATNATVLSLIGLSDAFIGGTDGATEMSWVWLRNPLDTIPLTVGATYTNWRTGEPNNQGGTNPDGEDCMIIEGDTMGTWDDRPCAPPPLGSGSYAYVCQY